MSNAPPYFSPATIGSVPFDSAARIRELQQALLDKKFESQRENILLAIHMYETGELPSQTRSRTWFVNGKVADFPRQFTKGMAVWGEGSFYQLMQTAQTSQIFARFRLMAEYGGDPNITLPVIIANDTGSNVQTVFTSDLDQLNYNPNTYQCPLDPAMITTASGVVVRQQIYIEVQLSRVDGTAASPWLTEAAVITPIMQGVQQTRLSGEQIRNVFYFATAPGNATLYVAMKKNGIVSQLPVV
ncbi:hypothetical protein GP486_004484 [Trichoglossum hirsutum]|uniref:Uncharacterized protein n=1 Tax=Trichoglossum hirsutum TaxID=265104 RepID=A0A9P8LB31_9PEZI|nr:hypothetical protein GP486_004484 [Trichoglossum hirsutum]